jgi:D-beta-D-heptose 7-phosphate kinase / D-beta-D-heptose 1-phosphate adenosyltransferase
MAETNDLVSSIDRLKQARVLCIGDVMLDHYVYGQVERVSPEAPIPVLSVEHELKTLGGAGNVLRNLTALGVPSSFISVVGSDDAGREIQRLLAAQNGAEVHALVQPQRTTTVKIRYVAANQQLLRADRETPSPLDPYIREDLLRLARELVTAHSVVIISDYAKGVLTEGVALEIIRAAGEAGARVIVDPKGGDHIRYRGADLLKPNRRELAHATGMPVATESEIVAAARALIERCGFATVLVSLGSEGMVLVGADGAVHVQRAQVHEVYDVSGAGDTVVAVVAAALGAGLGTIDAARLANVAAGIVVGKVGTAVAYPSELAACLGGREPGSADKVMPRAQALDLVERWRRQGLRIGFTNGCFDLLHPGHVSLISQARVACDRLVVGLNSDRSAQRLKGPTRPIQRELARSAVLASLAAVDLIVVFEEDTPIELIRAIRPNVLVKGADYRLDEVVGADIVKRGGGEVLLAKLMPGYSTTATIARFVRSA